MDPSKAQQAEIAALLGAIERMAADLALAEEPSRFVAALAPELVAAPEETRPS